MPLSPNTVTLGEVRFSYCNLFQPRAQQGQEPKYSVTVLLPKNNTAAKALLDAAVNYAIEQGVAKCWNGVRPPQPALCVHDGDGPRPVMASRSAKSAGGTGYLRHPAKLIVHRL